MALFGKKKKTEDAGEAPVDEGWRPQPEKAAKFFEHAPLGTPVIVE